MSPVVLSATLSAALQVLIFAAVPFLVYVVRRQTAKGFFAYVGLIKPERRGLRPALMAAAAVVPLLVVMEHLPGLREAAAGPGTVAGNLRAAGPTPTAIYALLVGAWVQTSLSEELLFRGFIGRRLIGWWGFSSGNALQALLFGAVHVGLLSRARGAAGSGAGFSPVVYALAFAIPAAYGWVLGWLKEQAGNGSVLPCWWVHGLGNTIAWAVVAFVAG